MYADAAVEDGAVDWSEICLVSQDDPQKLGGRQQVVAEQEFERSLSERRHLPLDVLGNSDLHRDPGEPAHRTG